MGYLLTTLLSYLLLYKYAAIFAVVFLAGLALPLPSNTFLLAAGAFASQGYMNVTAVFLVALASNVLGDCLGYALTRFWGRQIIHATKLDRFPSIGRIEGAVRKHANMAIFLTRFLGTPGVIVNFICGSIRVSFTRFLAFDIIGNALDTAVFLFVGYVLGVYTEEFSDISQIMGWIILVAIMIFLVVKLFLKRGVQRAE